MKSYDKKVSISIRKYRDREVIQLRRLPIAKYSDQKVVTGDAPTERNLERYRVNGWDEFCKLTQKDSKMSFEKFTETALVIINSDVTENTAKDRQSKIDNHLLPFFGKMKLEDISPKHVELWQSKLRPVVGADLTRRCKNLLNRILTRAVVHQDIVSNPVTGTETIKGDSKKIREIYTKNEISSMINESTGWLRIFIVIRVYLGLRSCEIVGLKWMDINFSEKRVKIIRGIRMGKIGPPKGRERTIDIPPSALKALQELKEQSSSEWVFVSSRGDYWGDCAYINRRHFQPFLKKIGVEYKSFYSLRHSYATYSWVGGQALPYVSNQLGHKDVETTVRFYTKYIAGIGGADKTEEILGF